MNRWVYRRFIPDAIPVLRSNHEKPDPRTGQAFVFLVCFSWRSRARRIQRADGKKAPFDLVRHRFSSPRLTTILFSLISAAHVGHE